MKLWKKMLVATAIGCGIYGVAYARRMTKAKKELLIMPSVILHSISLQELILRVDVTFINYTPAKIRLRFPFITIIYKGVIVGTSDIVNTEKEIKEWGDTTIEKILVRIPLGGLFTVVKGLLDAIVAKKTVSLTVKTKTYVVLAGVANKEITDEQTLPLFTGISDKK